MEYYKLHLKYFLQNEKRLLGDKRCCRFCGKKNPKVKFKQIAYAVPEFINKNDIINLYECDTCNSMFSKYENSFARLTLIQRASRGIKGKKGKVNIEEGIDLLYDEEKDSFKAVFSKGKTNSDLHIVVDKINKRFQIRKTITYNAMHINKMFAKIAIGLLPETFIHEYSEYIEWMKEESEIPNDNGLVFIGLDKPVENPSIALYINENGVSPKILLRLECNQHSFNYFLLKKNEEFPSINSLLTLLPDTETYTGKKPQILDLTKNSNQQIETKVSLRYGI